MPIMIGHFGGIQHAHRRIQPVRRPLCKRSPQEWNTGFFDASTVAGRRLRSTASISTPPIPAPSARALVPIVKHARALTRSIDFLEAQMADQYDLLVIGAGPGGYVAAIRGAQLGMKVGIIEREHMAGICSNWGCIPTKALLRSAEIYGHMSHAKDYGLTVEKFGVDIDGVVKRSRAIAAQMNNGVQFLMKKNKVDIIWGEAESSRQG
jgi:hypothetical protein